MSIILGIFLILHGMVHVLYSGQSSRLFELKKGMVWPDGSWAFEGLVGNEVARMLAIGACILAAIGFVVGGIALFATQSWWRPVVVAAAVFSALIFVFFWDGQMQGLVDKGLLAILINLAILVVLLVFRYPV